MARQNRDANGVCTDYKCRYCGLCERLNTEKCCRSLPEYQKKIEAWDRKMKRIAAEVVAITMAETELKSIRSSILDKLRGVDLDRVCRLKEIAERRPGIRIRFMKDGVEQSCFNCVHCNKTFEDEPCRNCLGGAERYTNVIPDPSGQFERYEYASHFEPKNQDREAVIRELAERYRPMVEGIKKDAKSKNVSVYEILAYMIGDFGAK